MHMLCVAWPKPVPETAPCILLTRSTRVVYFQATLRTAWLPAQAQVAWEHAAEPMHVHLLIGRVRSVGTTDMDQSTPTVLVDWKGPEQTVCSDCLIHLHVLCTAKQRSLATYSQAGCCHREPTEVAAR